MQFDSLERRAHAVVLLSDVVLCVHGTAASAHPYVLRPFTQNPSALMCASLTERRGCGAPTSGEGATPRIHSNVDHAPTDCQARRHARAVRCG